MSRFLADSTYWDFPYDSNECSHGRSSHAISVAIVDDTLDVDGDGEPMIVVDVDGCEMATAWTTCEFIVCGHLYPVSGVLTYPALSITLFQVSSPFLQLISVG